MQKVGVTGGDGMDPTLEYVMSGACVLLWPRPTMLGTLGHCFMRPRGYQSLSAIGSPQVCLIGGPSLALG
jgi:hypothetical protein